MSHTPSNVHPENDGLTALDFQALDALENDFEGFFDYLTTPHSAAIVCPPPAPQSSGDSLAAPAVAVQGVCTPTLEQFQRWLETQAHQA